MDIGRQRENAQGICEVPKSPTPIGTLPPACTGMRLHGNRAKCYHTGIFSVTQSGHHPPCFLIQNGQSWLFLPTWGWRKPRWLSSHQFISTQVWPPVAADLVLPADGLHGRRVRLLPQLLRLLRLPFSDRHGLLGHRVELCVAV